MDTSLLNIFFIYLFLFIDMSCRCLILSGYWEIDPNYHWSNTTGGIAFTVIVSNLSPRGCAAVCLYNSDCLMFGYINVTEICRDFRYITHSPNSTLEETEVIYKHTEGCDQAGYSWMEDGPLCVKMHSSGATWYNAKTQCEQDHGRLVIIVNAKKHQAYFSYGNGYSSLAWIGISDQEIEGTWVWFDGTDLNTSYWSFFQLNDYSHTYLPSPFNCDCGTTAGSGGLVDPHCLEILAFVCQRTDL